MLLLCMCVLFVCVCVSVRVLAYAPGYCQAQRSLDLGYCSWCNDWAAGWMSAESWFNLLQAGYFSLFQSAQTSSGTIHVPVQ